MNKTLRTIGEICKSLLRFVFIVTIAQLFFIMMMTVFFYWFQLSGSFVITQTVKDNALVVARNYSKLMFFSVISIIYMLGENVIKQIKLLNKNGNK
jgi:hypothetical protein